MSTLLQRSTTARRARISCGMGTWCWSCVGSCQMAAASITATIQHAHDAHDHEHASHRHDSVVSVHCATPARSVVVAYPRRSKLVPTTPLLVIMRPA
ncbi:MAG: hypothetical protein UHD09_03615 [Bifidobacterium sp.]|nr:hypothetical protein [Bifidobacterium sp.]